MPTRDGPPFAATVITTVPLALPLCPETIVSQPALLDADHEQPLSVEIPNDTCPPLAPTSSCERLNANVHGAPAWLSWVRSAPTEIELERAAGTGFGATLNGTLDAPWPSRAPVNDTHDASAPTDQVQSRSVEMVTVPDPPLAENDEGVLAIETEHLLAEGATTEEEVVEEVQAQNVPALMSAAPAHRHLEKRIRYTRSGT